MASKAYQISEKRMKKQTKSFESFRRKKIVE